MINVKKLFIQAKYFKLLLVMKILYNLYWIFIFILICVIGIPGFYVYDSVAVLGPFFKEELNFTQIEIAWLYSCYYYPNIILSFVAGIIIDKWGERKCSILFSIITVSGQFIISIFPTLLPMCIGRIILGTAAEGMFICQLKLFTLTFKSNISIVLALSLAFNRLCTWLAYITLTPIANINLYLAIHTCTLICIFCLIINIIFLIVVYLGNKNPYLNQSEKVEYSDNNDNSYTNVNIIFGIKQCLKSFPLWCLILIAFFYYGAFLSYASLSPIFIGKYYSLTISKSNFIVSLLSIGSIFGALIFGFLADKFGKRLFIILIGLFCGLVPFSIISITNNINIIPLTIFLGISYGSVPCILYSLISLTINKQYIGIATGLIETSNAWGVLIFPIMFGWILEKGSSTVGISSFTILLGLCVILVILLYLYSEFKMYGLYNSNKKISDITNDDEFKSLLK